MATTGKKQKKPPTRKLNYQTVTTGNLGKISQNFSNLASAISDCSDDGNQNYLSTYLNISQSPEEVQKRERARQLSKDKWVINADNASVAAQSTVSGAKN